LLAPKIGSQQATGFCESKSAIGVEDHMVFVGDGLWAGVVLGLSSQCTLGLPMTLAMCAGIIHGLWTIASGSSM
jgi:hypothetical protein